MVKEKKDSNFSLMIWLVVIVLMVGFSFNVMAISVDFVSPTPSNGSTIEKRDFIINTTINSNVLLKDLAIYQNSDSFSLLNKLVNKWGFDNLTTLAENSTYTTSLNGLNNITATKYTNASFINNGGKIGGRYYSNGGTGYGYVSSGMNIVNNNTASLSLWTKLDGVTSTNYQHIINKMGLRINIYYYTVDKRFTLKAINLTSTYETQCSNRVYNLGDSWINLIVTYNNSIIKMYADGVLCVEGSLNNGLNVSSDMIIGAESGSANQINGSVDELYIWNRTLTQDEVNKVYKTHLYKYNNTQYNLLINTSLINSNFNNYQLNVNDSSNNNANNNLSIRILSYLNFTNQFNKYINQTTYGTNIHSFLSDCGYQVDTNNDGTVDTCTNNTWHREKYLSSKMKLVRRDMSLSYYYSNYTLGYFNYSHSFSVETDLVQWANENDIKVLYITKPVPIFLANQTDYCKSNNNSCPPNNYSLWINMINDFIYQASANGTYNSSIEVEVWNEPNLESWLSNLSLTNVTKSVEYNKLFNFTYYGIKSLYPNIKVGGSAVTYESIGSNIISDNFIGNFSNITDFVSFHSYNPSERIDTTTIRDFNNIVANLTRFTSDLPDIYITEFNNKNSSINNNTNNWNIYSSSFASIYSQLANRNQNVYFVPYQWSEQYKYGQYYNEYPKFYNFVSEPQISDFAQIFPPYSVTSNFTRYNIGNNYNTSSSYGNILITYNNINSASSLILTNIEDNEQNLTVVCGGYSGNFIDVSNGNLYSCASGQFDLGRMSAYDVRYLTTPTFERSNNVWYVENYLGEPLGTISDSQAQELGLEYEGNVADTCENSTTAVGGIVGKMGLVFLVILLGGAIFIVMKGESIMAIGIGIITGLIGVVVLVLTLIIVSDLAGTGC